MTAQGYGVNHEQFTFDIEEGNFTRNDSMITDKGIAKGGSFATEVTDGMAVQIYVSTGVDMTLQKGASGTVVGFVDGPLRGALPKATASSGTYTRRYANVTLVGYRLIRVKLVAGNAAVAPGDSLAIDSTKIGYDKEEDSTTNVIAMETAGASSGLAIWALEKGVAANEAD
jgi:hypothetical protein